MRREGDMIDNRDWLLPLSWIYGVAVNLRNRLYDIGFLKSRSYRIPVISVGNITVGGSGKTPHVEYLIGLLQEKTKVAVLSRGYKRKSKGYQLADDEATAATIGDEPYQIMRKFPEAIVAVDADRRRGIERLTSDDATRDVDVILLDDAYQHRRVKPGVNILLVDYHRLILYDRLLPAGRLREPIRGSRRADMVIITKCPRDLKPMEYRVLTKSMNLYPYQGLYFTTLEYGSLTPVFPESADQCLLAGKESLKDYNVLLLTGIASPRQMLEDLEPCCLSVTPLEFSDHHYYKAKDLRRINERFDSLPSPKVVVTTEKDAARLYGADGLSEDVRRSIYALPVAVDFMLGQKENFNQKILSYVQKNSRNSILAKATDDTSSKDSHHPGQRPGRISFRDS